MVGWSPLGPPAAARVLYPMMNQGRPSDATGRLASSSGWRPDRRRTFILRDIDWQIKSNYQMGYNAMGGWDDNIHIDNARQHTYSNNTMDNG